MTEQNVEAGGEQTINSNADGLSQENEGFEQKEEKLIPQSEVDKLVYAKKMEGLEKGFAKGRDSVVAEMTAQKNVGEQHVPLENQAQTMPMTAEEVRRISQEQANINANNALIDQQVSAFANKLEVARTQHADFDDMVAKLDLPNIRQDLLYSYIALANGVDNSAEVVYEMAKNPTKFANMLNVIEKTPRLAFGEFAKLSQSIKKNEEAAKNQTQAPEPLDQTKPSTTGTDNGKMSVSDLRNQDWLRG